MKTGKKSQKNIKKKTGSAKAASKKIAVKKAFRKSPEIEKKSSVKKTRKGYSKRKNDFYLKNGKTRLMGVSGLEKVDLKTPYRRRSDLARCEKLDDGELVNIVLGQNADVYRILFSRYEKSLYIYMFHMVRNKEEVEDLLQNVFAKTFKSLHRFDTERKFSSWIYRIAHNEAVNFIKRKSKRMLVSWEDVSASKDKLEMSVDAEDTAEIFMHKEISREVDEALKELPEKYKSILMMRYFEEYSYQKIGKILGKPVNTVGTLINRAKKRLFEVIKEKRK